MLPGRTYASLQASTPNVRRYVRVAVPDLERCYCNHQNAAASTNSSRYIPRSFRGICAQKADRRSKYTFYRCRVPASDVEQARRPPPEHGKIRAARRGPMDPNDATATSANSLGARELLVGWR